MKTLVLGATGVAGRSLLPRLTRSGHETLAHVRSADKAAGCEAWEPSRSTATPPPPPG
jgi:uncharacterized protein YbjT (DUF2867 family)